MCFLKIIFIVNLYSCWVLYFCVRKNLKDLKDENSLLSYLTKLSLQTDATDNNMFEIQMLDNSFEISAFISRYFNVCFISWMISVYLLWTHCVFRCFEGWSNKYDIKMKIYIVIFFSSSLTILNGFFNGVIIYFFH